MDNVSRRYRTYLNGAERKPEDREVANKFASILKKEGKIPQNTEVSMLSTGCTFDTVKRAEEACKLQFINEGYSYFLWTTVGCSMSLSGNSGSEHEVNTLYFMKNIPGK